MVEQQFRQFQLGRDPELDQASPVRVDEMQRLADRAVPVDDDGETTEMLVEVAGRVDGLPLALELVAGQASGRSWPSSSS